MGGVLGRENPRGGACPSPWGPATGDQRLHEQAVLRLGTTLSDDQVQRAKLAVSELVTTAVTHGEGNLIIRAARDGRRPRVEVTDQGSGLPTNQPTPRRRAMRVSRP
jgi:anti-sigma regulatory factor (Ser/Thr protein kinase)